MGLHYDLRTETVAHPSTNRARRNFADRNQRATVTRRTATRMVRMVGTRPI